MTRSHCFLGNGFIDFFSDLLFQAFFGWRGLFLFYQNLHLHRAVLRHRKSLLEIPIFPFAECTPYAHPQVSACRVQGVIKLYAPFTGLFLRTLQTAENKNAVRKPCYQDLLTATVCKIKTPALYV